MHGYFLKVNDSSSSSVWDTQIRKSLPNGVSTLNLGDGSFLTSEGKIDTGDIVLISAWYSIDGGDTNTDDKSTLTSGEITKCVNFIHTVDVSASSWVEKIVLPDVKPPTCSHIYPNVTLTGHNFTIENSSTVEVGAFIYNIGDVNRNDLYQDITKYSQDLYLGRQIENTLYNVGESSSTLIGTNDYTYSYITSGDYNMYTRVFNYLGYYCETTNTVRIKYNQPNIDFTWIGTKQLNTDKKVIIGNDDLSVFTNTSTPNFGDDFTQLQANWDWSIEDTNQNLSDNTDVYTTQVQGYQPSKLFNTQGDKTISLQLNWHDGFDQQVVNLDKTLFCDVYSINPDFDWSTAKNYLVLGVAESLGDDDLLTINNLSSDNASQDYNSTTEWVSTTYDVTKLLNDGVGDDNEYFSYTSGADTFVNAPSFYIRFLHRD
jgi:hypothetical protein